jgi:hypothetical protein
LDKSSSDRCVSGGMSSAGGLYIVSWPSLESARG